jgi:hypothetical protein
MPGMTKEEMGRIELLEKQLESHRDDASQLEQLLNYRKALKATKEEGGGFSFSLEVPGGSTKYGNPEFACLGKIKEMLLMEVDERLERYLPSEKEG